VFESETDFRGEGIEDNQKESIESLKEDKGIKGKH
jgi:hypothetical protein